MSMHDSLIGVVDLNLGWVRAFIFHQELTLMYWLTDTYQGKISPLLTKILWCLRMETIPRSWYRDEDACLAHGQPTFDVLQLM